MEKTEEELKNDEEEKAKQVAEDARQKEAAETEKARLEAEGKGPLDILKLENDRKEKLIADENKILDRKEKMIADELAMGKGQMIPGGEPAKTEEQIASDARVKQIGEAVGADWAKKM